VTTSDPEARAATRSPICTASDVPIIAVSVNPMIVGSPPWSDVAKFSATCGTDTKNEMAARENAA
jgi:hypothetical protein